MSEVGFNWRGRQKVLESLHEPFDIIVVGGGINGCGVAFETARRGYRVLLLEKGDIGSGTSSRSSRLIHGGLRYLKHGHIKVVWEGCQQRYWLRTHYPYFVRPIPFLIPFYQGEGEGPVLTILGLWLYDLLSAFRNVKKHRRLTREEVLSREPMIRAQGLDGGAIYFDCLVDDFRLVLLNASMAHGAGADILSYCRMDAPIFEDGRVAGVQFEDLAEGGTYEVRGSVVVNTTGAWSDTVRMMVTSAERLLRPTKGIHLLLPREKIGNRNAVVIRSPTDRRVLFALPWGDYTIVGTTDTDFAGNPDQVGVEGADVDYLLEAVNSTFPDAGVRRNDVVSTYAALRPLIGQSGRTESEISRDYRIVEEAPGMLSLLGGKLTTYRPPTIRVADRVSRMLGQRPQAPREPPSPASQDASREDFGSLDTEASRRAAQMGLDEDVADNLVTSYGLGVREVLELATEVALRERIVPGLPYIMAEVVYSMEAEMAMRLEDVLVRRTKVFYEDPRHGLDAAEDVAHLMAERSNWSEERRQRELEDYKSLVQAMETALKEDRGCSSS